MTAVTMINARTIGPTTKPWRVVCHAGGHHLDTHDVQAAVDYRVTHDRDCAHYGTACTHRTVARGAQYALMCVVGTCGVTIGYALTAREHQL